MINIQVNGLEDAMSKFDRIKSPKLRKSILQKAGRQVAKSSKARINSQTDLTGARFTPASDGSKRKLLIGKPHGKGLRNMLKVIGSNADEVTVGWSNRLLAYIANQHQYGATVPTKARKRKNQVDPNAPATRQMANSLLAAGFKTRRRGKGYATPSIKWITENLKMGQAGLILRAIRHTQSTGVTKIPARSFLGFTPDDLRIIGEILNTEIEAALNGTQTQ
jgi:hypothetical protein